MVAVVGFHLWMFWKEHVPFLVFSLPDIDECVTGAHTCTENQTCFNIQGGFRCLSFDCPNNYRRAGETWVSRLLHTDPNEQDTYSWTDITFKVSFVFIDIWELLDSIGNININRILTHINTHTARSIFLTVRSEWLLKQKCNSACSLCSLLKWL